MCLVRDSGVFSRYLGSFDEWLKSLTAYAATSLVGGWAFAFAFYGRLGVDVQEVGIGPEGLLPKSLPIFGVLAFVVFIFVWPASFVINLNGDNGKPAVSRSTFVQFCSSVFALLFFSVWLWQFLANRPWDASSSIVRLGLWVSFLVTPIVLCWLVLVALIGTGYLPKIPLVSLQTLALVLCLLAFAAFMLGYAASGYVREGGEISTPLFRAERQTIFLSDDKAVGCLHYLGSADGMSIFYDSEKRVASRRPTENIHEVRSGCAADQNDQEAGS